ncbi:hypothetical protein GCM10010910_02940 [Microbacterium nanhaiense]|uniref:Secreted protein n=2 Tax=Microbacterium nanhaiense TaxID=1301026 RepID=A0ABQ2MVW7_9MICO|nr:hypothetical protein GCM10010910_02940 [Microbacterium nanhaiense]
MMDEYGNAIIVVPIVCAVVLAVAIGAIAWARGTMRRARRKAEESERGTAGLPPGARLPGGEQPGMWRPQDPALWDWTWSGGRAQPPDVLAGRHAVYDTVVARELRGSFGGRDAFSQVRRPQKLPVLARSAPQTHWGMVAGMHSAVVLPPFFVLTRQSAILTGLVVLDVADHLQKFVGALGPGTVLWSEPQHAALVVRAMGPALSRGTAAANLIASDGSTLFVCGSRGEDEADVLARLRCGAALLDGLERILTERSG